MPVPTKAIGVQNYGPPSVLNHITKVETRDPQAGEVLIALEAAGVNPLDTYIREGSFSASFPAPSYVSGCDGAGTVAALGPSVDKFQVGDPVYVTKATTGTYATHCIARANHTHRLPDGLSLEQGACLGIPYHTAFRCFFQSGRQHTAAVGEDHKVLILGASGGVGIAAVHLAKRAGYYVVGVAGSSAGLRAVEAAGAHEVVNRHHRDYVSQLQQLAAPGGFDNILEVVANENLVQDFGLAARKGRILLIGNRGEVKIDPNENIGKEVQVIGVSVYHFTPEEAEAAASIAKLFSAASSSIQKYVRPVVSETYTLEEAAQAHVDVMEHHKKGATGKLIIRTEWKEMKRERE